MVTGFIQDVFDPIPDEGFKYAFKNLLQSIADQDEDFIKNNCDRWLSSKINDGFLKDQKVISKENNIQEQILYGDLVFHFGINTTDSLFDRKDQIMRIMKLDGFNIKIYNFDNLGYGKANIRPVMTVSTYIRSNVTLDLENEEQANPNGYHHVVFQVISNTPILTLDNSMTGMFGLIQQDKRQQFLKQMIFGDNYTWQINNIDDSIR